jgi:hypothetical protein
MIIIYYIYAMFLALLILVLGPIAHGLAFVMNHIHEAFEYAADKTRLF